ncbi:hypothetical protein RDI58_021829 [Solanum bulbocastanum]|uniref:DNA topoisomerase (ATP-hydrolyzing) n=1 Tax=Solanum bulbocastanum TaxID=147425 RepID=A0AAN8T0Z0_SOLBU
MSGLRVAPIFSASLDIASKLEGRPFQSKLKPDSVILQTLKALKSSCSTTSKTLSLFDVGLSSTCREVTDLPIDEVQSKIESLVFTIAKSILSGEGYSFSVPSRSAANQLYVSELNRIVLKDKSSARNFGNVSTVRKATITLRILQLVHQLCTSNIHMKKRDIFYTSVKLFQDQMQSDAVLDDVSCIVRCTRSSLNMVAAEKGVVVGRFYNRFPYIIMTANGQPDVATRLFLRKMKMELNLPVLALVDSDPYGLKILSVYG